MGMTPSINTKIFEYIKSDNIEKIKEMHSKGYLNLNIQITTGRTAIVLCALFDSIQCLRFLIENGNDINIPDKTDNSTPLIIASKFGFCKIIRELIAHNCDVNAKNALGLNALDMGIIRGNYNVCFLLITITSLYPDKSFENYEAWNRELCFPIFNIDLFYKSLMNKVPTDKVPSFAITKRRKKMFEGKVPDPNETWSDFAKRLYRLELYQPPLVDKDSVDNKETFYMRMQSRLCEMEYGVKIDLKDNSKDANDIEMNSLKGEKLNKDESKSNIVNIEKIDVSMGKDEGKSYYAKTERPSIKENELPSYYTSNEPSQEKRFISGTLSNSY